MTGIGTVLTDNPSMTVRLGKDELAGVERETDIRQPLRLVLDSSLSMPPDAAILEQPGETVVVTTSDDEAAAERLLNAGATVLRQDHETGIDLRAVMEYLAETGVNEVLVESGATLAGAAVETGLVDELVIYMAPHLMGDSAHGLLHLPGIGKMEERIALKTTDLRQVGEDIRMTFSLRD